MRIAFVTSEYITEQKFDGGLANYLYRIVSALKGRGHQPVVFVVADRDEVLEHEGVPVVRVGINRKPLWFVYRSPLRRFNQPCKWLCESWSLRKALEKAHAHTGFDLIQYASYRASGFFRLADVPAVIRISSLESLWRENNGRRLDAAGRCEDYLELAALRQSDALFGPSRAIADEVEKRIRRKVRVIESPYVIEECQTDDLTFWQTLQGKQYLLFFGSLNVMKGMLTIGDILEPLFDTHPDLYFAFAGKVDCYNGRPLDEYLRQRAGRHRERLLFLGRLSRPQLMPVVRNAIGVVLPSRIDNLPNTCIEAMACGQIVIGTRGASFEQLIVDGESGFLIDVDASDQLLQATENLLNLSEESRERIRTAARRMIDRLSPETVCCQLEEFYSGCMQGLA